MLIFQKVISGKFVLLKESKFQGLAHQRDINTTVFFFFSNSFQIAEVTELVL